MNERTKNFQGLRLLFLLGIAFMHADMKFIGEGWLICTFFFVLSGFLYKQPEKWGVYYKKKLLKIFPLYWLSLVVCIFVRHIAVKWDIIPHVLLLQSYIPSPSVAPYYYEYVGVSWFISSLLFCYIISPPLYMLVTKIKKSNVQLVLVTLVLAMFILRSSLRFHDGYGIWLFYISPFYRILEYLTGMLLAIMIRNLEPRKMQGQEIISILLVFLIVFYLRKGLAVEFIPVVFLFFIYYVYMYKSVLMDVVFGNKVVVFIARYGMALYLFHQFLFFFFWETNGFSRFNAILTAIIVSVAIGYCYSKILSIFTRKKS
ncbi:MAG: acyltransferase [Bacteroidales bacterium]|nr:acyltransferase [Bacteroidales bacterium]